MLSQSSLEHFFGVNSKENPGFIHQFGLFPVIIPLPKPIHSNEDGMGSFAGKFSISRLTFGSGPWEYLKHGFDSRASLNFDGVTT